MTFRINHLHIKTRDPDGAASWFAKAFDFRVLTDFTRPEGDRLIRCQTQDGGLGVNFSSERDGETLPPATVGAHLGLEHFGIDSTDLEADIARLVDLGAILAKGPALGPTGRMRIAFLDVPYSIRVEIMQKISDD